VQQLTRIERRQTRIKRIRQKIQKERFTTEDIPNNPEAKYEMGVSENCKQRFSSFIEEHKRDPAAIVSFVVLRWGLHALTLLAELLVKTQGAPIKPHPRGAHRSPSSHDNPQQIEPG
jgi:hypothetical protein